MTANRIIAYKEHRIEHLLVKRSDLLPRDKEPKLFLPNPLMDVWRVDDTRDFERYEHAVQWIDGGNADTERALRISASLQRESDYFAEREDRA